MPYSEVTATLEALARLGIEPRHFDLLRSTKSGFARRLGSFWKKGISESHLFHLELRQLMGENFLGVEESALFLGAQFSQEQLACLEQIPWSMEKLDQARSEGFVLMAAYPLSIHKLATISPSNFCWRKELTTKKAYKGRPDIDHQISLGWHLIKRNPVFEERSRKSVTFMEKILLLKADENLPEPVELFYFSLLNYLVNGEIVNNGLLNEAEEDTFERKTLVMTESEGFPEIDLTIRDEDNLKDIGVYPVKKLP